MVDISVRKDNKLSILFQYLLIKLCACDHCYFFFLLTGQPIIAYRPLFPALFFVFYRLYFFLTFSTSIYPSIKCYVYIHLLFFYVCLPIYVPICSNKPDFSSLSDIYQKIPQDSQGCNLRPQELREVSAGSNANANQP